MTKLFLYILSIILLYIPIGSCTTPEGPEIEVTPRAVLVYMVANNSLGRDGYDYSDLNEMVLAAQAGDFGDSRLFVYHHPRRENPRLMEITVEGTVIRHNYDDATFSTDPNRMLEVIHDFRYLAPADNYGIILWSHGSGWLQDGYEFTEQLSPQSFGQDGLSGDSRGSRRMNVTDLASTLEGQGFDYVYFDCCYMGGIEVMYQMRNVAPRIVASATEIPADGMPYDLNLRYLLQPDAKLVDAANSTFEYYDARSGESRTCTMVVVNTEPLERLAELTGQIYSYKHAVSPGFSPQRYTLDSPCRYFDFRQYVHEVSVDQNLLEQWEQVYDEVIVYKNQTPKLWNAISLNRHSGLSTYILERPADITTKNYLQLDWYNDVVIKYFE